VYVTFSFSLTRIDCSAVIGEDSGEESGDEDGEKRREVEEEEDEENMLESPVSSRSYVAQAT
jgi:hypothetical protein